ncbi:hypothetical protein KAW38_05005 [Candidatus Micrarchaeota archaeon]|nr:hypothetical protein [Candidatus Micrarchaeota archaeon]
MIEGEVIHWWKDDKAEQHRTVLRIESESPSEVNGFPRDGIITLRIMNTTGKVAIKLSPDEALRAGNELLVIAKEQMYKKRKLWNRRE